VKLDVNIVSMVGEANKASGIHEVPDTTTANGLISILNLPTEETYALMVNDMPVAIPDRDSFVLGDGDRITIFPPIKGG
jgi:sulfur carrier protein ThiS